MTVIPGSWAGMIPFSPVTSRCKCWIYDLPLLTNESTGLESWTLVTTSHPGTGGFGGTPYFDDNYTVVGPETGFGPGPIQDPTCTGYTATFEIFDIPPSIPASLLSYLAAYAATNGPNGITPYSAGAEWQMRWAGVRVEIILNLYYQWVLPITVPNYQFSTSWRLVEDTGGMAGTPDFAFVPPDFVIGTPDTMTGINHPLAGVYTITDAELGGGTVNFSRTTGATGAVNDVIGQLTFVRAVC